MQYTTPEQVGLSSADVLNFYKDLERFHFSTHSVVMMRGDKIFSEAYYAPFTADFKHRMYSTSKSFVSIAVGFCEQDGLLSLDDPMTKFFPEYKNENWDAKLLETTVRDMLMMETSMEKNVTWFSSGTSDRTEVYFRKKSDKHSGCINSYDSSGSYMLGVIVERVTGKPFLDYLKEKVLCEIGFSPDAYCILAPGGHSFGDSGVMCTSRDLLLFARFVLNGGTYNGKRYLNKDYIKAATTMSVCTDDYGFATNSSHGYGYQFWGAPEGCFATHGMGTQVSLCDPKHDFVFVITADNQGFIGHYDLLYEALYRNIIHRFSDAPLSEDGASEKALRSFEANAKLFSLSADSIPPFFREISGKTFFCDPAPMGWKWFRFDLEDGTGTLTYENKQGEKSFRFGIGHNEFGKFPETGYADTVATVPVPGHRYDGAFSADFPEPQKLRIRVQIIDKYFGNLGMVFGFKDADRATVRMKKTAEYFLMEYDGLMNAHAK